MASFTQTERVISVKTPLPADTLLLKGMTATERLSSPFDCQLDLISEDFEIAASRVLGQPMTVSLHLLDGSSRWFNGICSRFSHAGHEDRFCRYRATLVPWFWLLTRSSDCKIFQEMTVPDIIKKVFRDAGFTDFEDALSGNYPTREYCVQYRETHFNFVSRLMEQYGIYYFFKHRDGKHTLVLADAYGAHEPFPGHEQIPYHLPDEIAVREQDYIFDWNRATTLRSGAFAHDDYDFTSPRSELLGQVANHLQHEHNDLEIYDYPGEYDKSEDANGYARVHVEELQSDHALGYGQGVSRGIAVGSLFTLADHPWREQNQEYLVTSAVHHLRSNEFISTGRQENGPPYRSSFQVIPANQPFRPPRITPKPAIHGLQTAVVVGKSGEEIWTDKYGRIKVQFHWDRYGKKDENSSCWMRVAYGWAGKQWGAVAIPRIGQEVVVSFLEGDPDRPLVVSSVYNADQMPPYGLPSNQTQSGVKTRSSKGGGADNFNELRFEDKKGSEDVYFHAEKDFHRMVEHDDDLVVMNNQTIEVKQNRTEVVTQGNEKITIKQGNRTEELSQGNETVTIKMGNRKVELGMGNDDLTLEMGNQTTKLSLGKSTTDAMQSIELKVGQSSVKVDQMGVTIKGMMIKIEGQVTVDVKGVMTTVKGDGMLTLKGGLTMIN
ncbi:MAG: type VI secretion system tip protein VgrG [Thiohalocapsa sp.]|uniref:type VI secretion system Vgr family protein n=1 Tax=Thiohalocapsa sp. TaxID=2497641 RepID=UPI0025F6D338|nr:type VI secretion system tip protein VgrG [Thiohalocapsa sp.]MCG6942504.1 type VI secretion system tip protein VgrG [Thiohalocapsa sp.]